MRRELRSLSMAATVAAVMVCADVAAASSVGGRVTGPGGVGIPDVDLDVDDLISGERLVILDDNTDVDGDWVLELDQGLYQITFTPLASTGLAPHVISRVEVITTIRNLDVQLVQGVSLNGRVTNLSGNGVVDVDLDVIHPATRAKLPTPSDNTNAFGFYDVIVPPGTYDIVFTPPVATRLLPKKLSGVDLTLTQTVDTVLQPGVAFTGTVSAAGGGPAQGVDIDVVDAATREGLLLAGDKTDAAGQFTVIVPPGTYDVGVDAPVTTRLVSRVVEDVVITADFSGTYPLTPGFLVSGKVTGAGSVVVEGADVDLQIASTLETIPTPFDRSDFNGDFAVVVPAGTYRMMTKPPAASSYGADTTNVDVGADTVKNIRLPGGPPIVIEGGVTLLSPYPNPFRATSTIAFEADASAAGRAKLMLYDTRGARVRTLFEGNFAPGRSELLWDGRDTSGSSVAAGMYYLVLESAAKSESQKILFLR